MELHAKGIITGYDETNFKPNVKINRAEFTQLILKSFNYVIAEKIKEKPFTDVPLEKWYAPAVATAVEQKLIKGYSDGTFRPEQIMTRAEALKVALEASKTTIKTTKGNEYSDLAQNAWYTRYINFATSEGIMTGYNNGTFRPSGQITRGEVTKIISTILDRL